MSQIALNSDSMKDPLRHAIDEGQIIILWFLHPEKEACSKGRTFTDSEFKWEFDETSMTVEGRRYEIDFDFYMDYGIRVENDTEAIAKGQKWLDENLLITQDFAKNIRPKLEQSAGGPGPNLPDRPWLKDKDQL